MDEAVIKYYRRLMNSDFEHFGAMDDPSIFVESAGNRLSLCGIDGGFMEIYASVVDDVIEDIKYKCSCDPTANVAVELLCILMKGKTLDEAAAVTDQSFCDLLGSDAEDLRARSRGLLDLLARGIERYRMSLEAG